MKFIVNDMVEYENEVMDEKTFIEYVDDWYETMEPEFGEEYKEPKPKNHKERIEYLNIFGIHVRRV